MTALVCTMCQTESRALAIGRQDVYRRFKQCGRCITNKGELSLGIGVDLDNYLIVGGTLESQPVLSRPDALLALQADIDEYVAAQNPAPTPIINPSPLVSPAPEPPTTEPSPVN